MAKVLALPTQSFCIGFELPRRFYYTMLVNDVWVRTRCNVSLDQCDPKHRVAGYFPRHLYRLVVIGRCPDAAKRTIRSLLSRYRNLAQSLAPASR